MAQAASQDAEAIVAQPERTVEIVLESRDDLTAGEIARLEALARAGDADAVDRFLAGTGRAPRTIVTSQTTTPVRRPPPAFLADGSLPLMGVALAAIGAGAITAFTNDDGEGTPTPAPATTPTTPTTAPVTAPVKPHCTDVTSGAQLENNGCRTGTRVFNSTTQAIFAADPEFLFSNTSAQRKDAGSTSPAKLINADVAYGYGLSGEGFVIGIIDAGFNLTHSDLVTEIKSLDAPDDRSNDDHGSNVAALALGARNGSGGQGIAYGAKGVVSNVGTDEAGYPVMIRSMAIDHKATVSSNSYGFGRQDYGIPALQKELDELDDMSMQRASIQSRIDAANALKSSENKYFDSSPGDDPNAPTFELSVKQINQFMIDRPEFKDDPAGALGHLMEGDKKFWQDVVGAFTTFQAANKNRGVVLFANSNNGNSDIVEQTRSGTSNDGLPLGLDDVAVGTGLPVIFPQLKGSWIAVVNALDKGVYDSQQKFTSDPDAHGNTTSDALVADQLPTAQKDLIVSKKGGQYTGRYLLSAPCGAAIDFCVSMDAGQVRAAGSGAAGTTGTTKAEFVNQTGTSQGTPQLAGAVALLQQAFPNLSGRDIVTRMLATADNTWFDHDKVVALDHGLSHGASEMWGHGFVNLAKALQPIGGTSVPLPPSLIASTASTGTTTPVNGNMAQALRSIPLSNGASAIQLSSAFGAGVAGQLGTANFAMTDVMNAAFNTSVGAYTSYESDGYLDDVLTRWGATETAQVAELGNGVTFSYTRTDPIAEDRDLENEHWRLTADLGRVETILGTGDSLDAAMGFTSGATAGEPVAKIDDAFDIPYFSLATDETQWGAFRTDSRFGETTFGVFSSEDDDLESYGFAANHRWAPTDGIEMLFTAGAVAEEGGMLGTRTSGAFANDRAISAVGRAGIQYDLGEGYTAKGAYMIARTQTDGGDGLFQSFSPIMSDSFALGVEKRGVMGQSDHIALTLSQPLRVMSADATLTLPVFDGAGFGFTSRTVDMTPEAREMRLTASYAADLNEDISLDLGAALVKDAGHVSRDGLDLAGFVGMKIAF